MRAGTDKLQQGGTVHALKTVKIIPKYGLLGITDYDVAVLQLATAIKLDSTRKAVTLPDGTNGDPTTNLPVTVSGWGLTTVRPVSTLKTLQSNCLQLAKKTAAWYYEAIFVGITNGYVYITNNLLVAYKQFLQTISC